MPMLLWRRVLNATIDTLKGKSKGQYDIRLGRPPSIEAFLAGLDRTGETPLGGYDVRVPLSAAPAPLSVPPWSITAAYIGPRSTRADWRIPSQRPDTAYPLWRLGTGLLDDTPPNQDFVVLLRDQSNAFHARWLRGSALATLPDELAAALKERDSGVAELTSPQWRILSKLLHIPESAKGAEGGGPPADAERARAGEGYRIEDENVTVVAGEPFAVDPDAVDRGLGAHRKTQNALSNALAANGRVPLSPRKTLDPPFDIAWRDHGTMFVGEVKSVTASNEEKQLRLGLGQVLRYAFQLRAEKDEVVPVLIAEREPRDPSWAQLCESLGVQLIWGPDFDGLLSP